MTVITEMEQRSVYANQLELRVKSNKIMFKPRNYRVKFI